MKELSIEQKAQRYDKAIKRANSLLSSNQLGNAWIYKLLPELKESYNKDERIREALLYVIEHHPTLPKEESEEYIAWLEKKGEKPDDKVEPKFNFKVGQWIVATGKCVYLIVKIDGFNVTLVDTNGDEYVFDISSLEDAHLWDITKDAKDGDVLIDMCGNVGMYKTRDAFDWTSYCSLGRYFQRFKEEHENRNTYPATQKQRDALMKAMADAGYEFDFEKKELKKIENEIV